MRKTTRNGHISGTNFEMLTQRTNGVSQKESSSRNHIFKTDFRDIWDKYLTAIHFEIPKLYRISEVSAYLRFNPYIRENFRDYKLTFRQSILSWFYIPNETVNILSRGEFDSFRCFMERLIFFTLHFSKYSFHLFSIPHTLRHTMKPERSSYLCILSHNRSCLILAWKLCVSYIYDSNWTKVLSRLYSR